MSTPVRLATVLFPSGPANDVKRKHLFVFLTDPYGAASQVLMVPVCSVEVGAQVDESCLLDSGCHSFIRHRSYVNYALCRTERADAIANGIRNGQFIPKEPVSEDIFRLIIAGMRRSKFTKPFALEFFGEFEEFRESPKTK